MHEKIQEFFDRHDILPKKENARSFIFDCPCCGSSEKLYIEKSNGRSICFRHKTEECPTAKTPIAKVLSLISEVPIDKVKSEISDKITVVPGENLMDLFKDKGVVSQVDVPLDPINSSDLPADAKPILWKEAGPGQEYLVGRGIDLSTASKYGVLYSPGMRRVVFPVIHDSKIYGWQARTIDAGVEPRMYNLPGRWKNRTLMFYDNMKASDHVIVAEGAVSAMKFELVGGFVATMGKSISKLQIEHVVFSGAKKVYLALDRDAVDEMVSLVGEVLKLTNYGTQCYLIKVPPHRDDFGDCTYEECKKAFEEADLIDTICMVLYSYAMENI